MTGAMTARARRLTLDPLVVLPEALHCIERRPQKLDALLVRLHPRPRPLPPHVMKRPLALQPVLPPPASTSGECTRHRAGSTGRCRVLMPPL